MSGTDLGIWGISVNKTNNSCPHGAYILTGGESVESVKPSDVSDSFATPWGAAHQAPWDFPAKNIGVACHFLFRGIFPTQGLNPGLLNCRQILYQLTFPNIKKKKTLLLSLLV